MISQVHINKENQKLQKIRNTMIKRINKVDLTKATGNKKELETL